MRQTCGERLGFQPVQRTQGVVAGGGNDGDTESERLYTFGVAFQYQAMGGFVVRPGLYGLVPSSSSDDFLVLPGVTLAGSF